MESSNCKVELSVVTTVYNDALIVPLLVNEIKLQCEKLNKSFEIIHINDRIINGNYKEIKIVRPQYKYVNGITSFRNYGQEIAISASKKENIVWFG